MATNKDRTIWGIHAGKTGEVDSLFLKQNVIALGWTEMGDLTKLPANRDGFKARLLETRPGKKERYYWIAGGQLFRFVHEVKTGDTIVYASKRDRNVHIGEIAGPYQYHPDPDSSYPHRRPVKWLRSAPRTQFTQGALYEIGSALSFFRSRIMPTSLSHC